MEKYSYKPLKLDRPAIRLLHLHSGGNNSEISCNLSLVDLNQRNDTISYEALSYTWGFADFFERIIVDGCYLNITYNLHSVLQQLRHSDVDRILWIDAVCIDQENKKERGHQVEQMSKIYSEAERVIFWLGPGTFETDMLMESLQLLQHESIHHRFGDWSLQDNRWKNLWTCMETTFESSTNNSELYNAKACNSFWKDRGFAGSGFYRKWRWQRPGSLFAAGKVCQPGSLA